MPGDSDGLAGVGGQATRISSFIMLAGKPEQGWVALAYSGRGGYGREATRQSNAPGDSRQLQYLLSLSL